MSDSGDVLHDGSRKISTGGDYVARDKIVHIYGADAPRVTDYLKGVIARFGPLRERYIDLEGSAPPPPKSDDPFADVFLVTPIMRMEGQGEPTTVQKALYEDGHERLVMLGDPGAGKTTSLRVLLANAAEWHLAAPDKHPLPLLLELDAWPSEAPSLSAYIERHIKWTLPLGAKLLLLLDGLNEMGGENRKERIDSIRQYLREFSLARVIVTCRERDYTQELDKKINLPKLAVSELDDDRVRRLIHAYLPKDAAGSLWEAIQRREHGIFIEDKKRALLELARNPYMLTLLAWIYHQNGSLPESTAKLFEQLVELRWQHEDHPGGRAPFALKTLERALGDLAFEMIDQDKGTSVDMDWAREQLGERADELIRFGEACSVLVDSGDEVRFYHQLMQEYFAARTLDWHGDIQAMVRERKWRETLVMRATIGGDKGLQVIKAYISVVQEAHFDKLNLPGDAITALVSIGEPAATALVDVMRDVSLDKLARASAAAALQNMGKPAVAPLISLLGDPGSQKAAAQALGYIGKPAVQPLLDELRNALHEDTADNPLMAPEQNGGPSPEQLERLVRIFIEKVLLGGRPRWEVVKEALSMAGNRDVDSLVNALGDPDPGVRGHVADILGSIRNKQTVPHLIELLTDLEPLTHLNKNVSDVAADALRKIDTPEALAALRAQGFAVEEDE